MKQTITLLWNEGKKKPLRTKTLFNYMQMEQLLQSEVKSVFMPSAVLSPLRVLPQKEGKRKTTKRKIQEN